MKYQNLKTDCPHKYEFIISQFKNMKWWNYFKCALCGMTLKIYNSNLRHDQ